MGRKKKKSSLTPKKQKPGQQDNAETKTEMIDSELKHEHKPFVNLEIVMNPHKRSLMERVTCVENKLKLSLSSAKQLNIQTGDEIMIFINCFGGSAAICTAFIINMDELKLLEKQIGKKFYNSNSYCFLEPISLENHFLRRKGVEPEEEDYCNFKQNTSFEASPSKSKFSFQKNPSVIVIALSMSSYLSKYLMEHKILKARQVNLILQSSSKNTIDTSVEILKHLIRAYYKNNTFVQKNQLLRISFRGVSCEFQIKNVIYEKNHEALAAATTESLLKEEIEILEHFMSNSIPDLCKITCDTTFEFEIKKEKEGALFKKLGGVSNTLLDLMNTLKPPLLSPWLYNEKIKPPKGILLFGPSGTGKSEIAHQVKNYFSSNESVEVLYINCDQFLFSTKASLDLETYFFAAQTKTLESISTLLIFDNIEIISPTRSGVRIQDQITSTFLALLDGIDNNDLRSHQSGTVMILGITNDPSILDPALRRPGRLDVEVEVPIPDSSRIKEIIKLQLQNFVPHLSYEEEDLMRLVKLAKGFTGADILLSLKEAMRKAILNKTDVNLSFIQDSFMIFKPSTIRGTLGAVEVPTVHWSSIGGMKKVKSSLQEVINFPYRRDLGISPPRGVLLYGPPGCSKTLMARALATEGQMNFLAIKGPELLSKWLGESERSLASLFRRARQASPCLVFFDEIDAIATKRGYFHGETGGGQRLLSQLLTEMDGISSSTSHEKVIVIAATNRPDLLDPALLRPGRIDIMLYVGIPDFNTRQSIFEIALKLKTCSSDVHIPTLAKDEITQGFSGAEIVAICREAAFYAIEEKEDFPENYVDLKTEAPQIQMKHLLKSCKTMNKQITPEMLQFYSRFQNFRI